MSKAERKKFEIGETKEYVFQRDGYACQVCGTPVGMNSAQLAHMIPQNKRNLQKYGEQIIHHPENLLTTCSLRCNNAVQVNSPLEQEAIARDIYQIIEVEYIREVTGE